jgi:hypothetical protein
MVKILISLLAFFTAVTLFTLPAIPASEETCISMFEKFLSDIVEVNRLMDDKKPCAALDKVRELLKLQSEIENECSQHEKSITVWRNLIEYIEEGLDNACIGRSI